jgi:hypothetical protein
VLRHPWTGSASCPAGDEYRKSLPVRDEQQARTLAHLTGWSMGEIETRMKDMGQTPRAR